MASFLPALFALFAFLGCKTPEAGPTFHQDVAPVLDQYCMRCHAGDDAIAPMAFDTYDEVAAWGPVIAEVTANRTMPPKQIRGDGTCGDWQDPWWMEDGEIALLADWVEAGMPEGEPTDRTPPAPLPTIEPTHTVATPEFVPVPVGGETAEFDEYRCFPMTLEGVDETLYLTGFDVKPGNDRIVHHVIGLIVDPDAPSWADDGSTNAEQMARLQAAEGDRDGWPCFTGAGDDVAYESDPIGWAPGQGATQLPEGTGVEVPEGSIIVAQVHYNLIDPETEGMSDSTEVQLQLAPAEAIEKPVLVLYLDFLLAYDDTIPAGRAAYEYREGLSLNDLGVPISIDIIGMMPHMHERGTHLDVMLTREDGTEECLIDVDNWDFDWQFIYFYEEPVTIGPNDYYELTCTYDTSSLEDPVLAGWGTQNEMCLTVLYVTL
jgi:hypothetical protein